MNFNNNGNTVYLSTFTPTVPESPNQPLNAFDQRVTTNLGESLSIILKANAQTYDDELTAAIVSPPRHGQLSPNNQNDGCLTYTPDSGFTGNDEFTFKVNNSKEQ